MKKTIAFITAVVLFLCCFVTGCGKEDNETVSVLKGQTIKIAAWGDMSPKAGTELGDARLKRIAAAEEKYGCTVEFETISDLFSQMTLAASSGETLADVLMTRAHYIPKLANADALWAIEDINDTSNAAFNQNAFANTKVNGKSYGFYYDPYYVGYVLFFNKGILERAGVEYPYDMVKNKTWTYDAWLDIMKKVTDPSAGIMGIGMEQAFDAALMKSNDASIYAQDESGKWIANTSDNKVINALTFMADCVNKWKVMEPNKGRDWTYCPSQFKAGKYAFYLTYSWTAEDQSYHQMSDDYGIVPMPLGPDATEYVKPACELKAYCIQKSVSKEKAAALVEFMNEAFVYPLDEDSIEKYYQSLVMDKESLEVLLMLDELPVTQVDEFTTPDIRGTDVIGALEACSKGTKPIRSTLDSYKGSIQALLDEYYAQ